MLFKHQKHSDKKEDNNISQTSVDKGFFCDGNDNYTAWECHERLVSYSNSFRLEKLEMPLTLLRSPANESQEDFFGLTSAIAQAGVPQGCCVWSMEVLDIQSAYSCFAKLLQD